MVNGLGKVCLEKSFSRQGCHLGAFPVALTQVVAPKCARSGFMFSTFEYRRTYTDRPWGPSRPHRLIASQQAIHLPMTVAKVTQVSTIAKQVVPGLAVLTVAAYPLTICISFGVGAGGTFL